MYTYRSQWNEFSGIDERQKEQVHTFNRKIDFFDMQISSGSIRTLERVEKIVRKLAGNKASRETTTVRIARVRWIQIESGVIF